MQAQGVEAHCVFRVVLPPVAVRDLLQRLKGVVVARRKPLSTRSRAARSGSRAQFGRLQDRPQCPLRGHRMFPNELPVRDHHAAEVLRPGPVQRGC